MMPTHIDPADFLFVSTDLCILSQGAQPSTLEDTTVEGKTYRPMDPAYYAWLRRQMERARVALQRGRLSADAFDALRTQFNRLHDQAVSLFGESALLEAIESQDAASYVPPGTPRTPTSQSGVAPVAEVAPPSWLTRTPFAFPQDESDVFLFQQSVSAEAVHLVAGIRSQALSLGWTDSELFQTRGRFPFPCGGEYGLVCFLNTGHRLGTVSQRSIELVCGESHSLRFYRRNAS